MYFYEHNSSTSNTVNTPSMNTFQQLEIRFIYKILLKADSLTKKILKYYNSINIRFYDGNQTDVFNQDQMFGGYIVNTVIIFPSF